MTEQLQKKPSGLSKKRALPESEKDTVQESTSVFVLPEDQDDEEEGEDSVKELEVMMDTLEVTLAEESVPSKETVLLIRAIVHEADRILKNDEEGTTQTVEALLATALYYLGLYEREGECSNVDYLEAAIARFEAASIKDERAVRVRLALAVYSGEEFDGKVVDLETELSSFPPSKELAEFLIKRYEITQEHWILLSLANTVCEGELSEHLKKRTAGLIDERVEQELVEVKKAELLIVYGGLKEVLEQEGEAEKAYAEATRLLEGKKDLPEWVQDFLRYDPDAEESEDAGNTDDDDES